MTDRIRNRTNDQERVREREQKHVKPEKVKVSILKVAKQKKENIEFMVNTIPLFPFAAILLTTLRTYQITT